MTGGVAQQKVFKTSANVAWACGVRMCWPGTHVASEGETLSHGGRRSWYERSQAWTKALCDTTVYRRSVSTLLIVVHLQKKQKCKFVGCCLAEAERMRKRLEWENELGSRQETTKMTLQTCSLRRPSFSPASSRSFRIRESGR